VTVAEPRYLRMTQILRYGRPALPREPYIDGYSNFHYLTVGVDGTQTQLERGINGLKQIKCIDGSQRRPAIAVRSSPWKAGHEATPWHDTFDLDHGHVRYFGDHKASSGGPLGSTPGNTWLLEASSMHWEATPDKRVHAPPILLFRTVSVQGAVKGFVEFCEVAILERLEQVVQRDPSHGTKLRQLCV
jgi:Restriction endonuclease AspBHI N-terminal